jgi:hypothetical protein
MLPFSGVQSHTANAFADHGFSDVLGGKMPPASQAPMNAYDVGTSQPGSHGTIDNETFAYFAFPTETARRDTDIYTRQDLQPARLFLDEASVEADLQTKPAGKYEIFAVSLKPGQNFWKSDVSPYAIETFLNQHNMVDNRRMWAPVASYSSLGGIPPYHQQDSAFSFQQEDRQAPQGLEHFQQKWEPVLRPEMRNKELGRFHDSVLSANALIPWENEAYAPNVMSDAGQNHALPAASYSYSPDDGMPMGASGQEQEALPQTLVPYPAASVPAGSTAMPPLKASPAFFRTQQDEIIARLVSGGTPPVPELVRQIQEVINKVDRESRADQPPVPAQEFPAEVEIKFSHKKEYPLNSKEGQLIILAKSYIEKGKPEKAEALLKQYGLL